jgi:hypothetical protein
VRSAQRAPPRSTQHTAAMRQFRHSEAGAAEKVNPFSALTLR